METSALLQQTHVERHAIVGRLGREKTVGVVNQESIRT